MDKMPILLIDNFDSFTYNLVDEFEKRNCIVKVYRNDYLMEEMDKIIVDFKPKLIVVSPGPSSPKEAGISMGIIKNYSGKIPIFGVCLGHQCAIESFGGIVSRAKEIVHGKSDLITHDGKGIFEGLENPLSVGRYHSLAGTKIPDCLEVTARSKDGEVMGIKHKEFFVVGVQFHPESILTTLGGKIIENIITMCNKGENK